MRTRVGLFGTANAVIGVAFFVVFSAMVAFTLLSITSGTNVVWSSVGGALALVAAVWMALLARVASAPGVPWKSGPTPRELLCCRCPGHYRLTHIVDDEIAAAKRPSCP